MPSELVRNHDGHLTRLTLNRPRKANALSATLVESLIDAVENAHNDGTRLLILDGEGEHFCAGFDFSAYHDQSEGDLALRFIRIETLLQTLFHAPFTTLAMAHGKIFGAGADLIAACDARLAAPETTFRMPGLQFGVVLGTRRLAHRIGADHARTILVESRTFDADEALDLGFVTAIAITAEWPTIIQRTLSNSGRLTPSAETALHRQIVTDTRADDMAALARSVSIPGLKERIQVYREKTSTRKRQS